MDTEKENASSNQKNGLPASPTRVQSVKAVQNEHESPPMSGPELIMPSIYETPIAEKSWVAPNVRKQTSPNLRRRHQTSSESTSAKRPATDIADNSDRDANSTTTSGGQTQPRLGFFEKPIRTITNIMLLAAISHLLILPELVQQYQSVCSIGAISAIYPSSCISTYRSEPVSPYTSSRSAPIGAVSSQSRLESLFNSTLHEMTPLNNALKQTESQLQAVERELRRLRPGTKHELSLEFESCWRVIRVAAWKFDSLKVDLQSAVDSLVAAGDVKSAESRPSVAHDARLSTQMLRRENYINQLMARMRSKADSLAVDLFTLDDHLESIASIVVREAKRSGSSFTNQLRDSTSRLEAFVDALVPPSVSLPSFLRARDSQAGDSDDISKPTLLQLFHEASTRHRPVAGLARSLSKHLQQTPRGK